MSLNALQISAIYKLHTEAVYSHGDAVYDKDGNHIEYDLNAVDAKVKELLEDIQTKNQTQAAAKQAALAKLMALGLTEEEALALGK